jgi:hypothetical protein
MSLGLRENNDCAVVAVAAIMDVSYEVAHAALKACGREDRRGTNTGITLRAIQYLGGTITTGIPLYSETYKAIIKSYPAPHCNLQSITTHHPERFAKVWPQGRFLMRTRGHILAIVDGKNCDWTKGKAKRANTMWLVTLPTTITE